MSADAFVTSSRLRAPPILSSNPTAELRRLRLSQTSALLLATDTPTAEAATSARPTPYHTVYDVRLLRPTAREAVSNDPSQQVAGAKGDGGGAVTWLDLDRFEDWDLPELEVVRPDVRIMDEAALFPIPLAEDGETLPSGLHPSYPYGDAHDPIQPYIRRLKAWPVNIDIIVPSEQDSEHEQLPQLDWDYSLVSADSAIPKVVASDTGRSQPISTKIRARQLIAPSTPQWPFKRFGPGAGGPNALLKNEIKRPWRPYRNIWADMDVHG